MIRDATTADADAIRAIAREGFPPDLLKYTVFGAHGYASYVADTIRAFSRGWTQGRPARFRVFEDAGKVLGYAEWRSGSDRVHLNNIFVGGRHRGRGIGAALMSDVAAIAADRQRLVTAHVFAHNQRALAWYTRIGFSVDATRYWTLVDGGEGAGAGGIEPPSMKSASPEGQLERYGFDELAVGIGQKEVRIGRLGDAVLRYVEAEQSDEVIAALKSVFGRQELLVITSRSGLGVVLAEQHELSGSLAPVASRASRGREGSP